MPAAFLDSHLCLPDFGRVELGQSDMRHLFHTDQWCTRDANSLLIILLLILKEQLVTIPTT